MNEFKITVSTKPFDNYLRLYQRKEFTFKLGINSLVGCNGSGKTTLIDYFLVPQLRKQKIEYYKYNDRRQGGSYLMDKMLNSDGDMDGLIRMTLSSEGERIVCGLEGVIKALPRFFKENKNKSAFLILDAIDSGMSVDEINEIKELFLDTIIPDAKSRFGVDLFIVVAANNYEWCNDDRIVNINIITGTTLKFKDYADYKKQILKSRAFKNKQRGVEE